jgi:hypothetical protein
MADTTNWKLEGQTAQPRMLYLEHNDKDILYIYIYKMPKCKQDTTVQNSV